MAMAEILSSLAGSIGGSLVGAPGQSSTTKTNTSETSKTTTLPKDIQDLLETITSMQVTKALESGKTGDSLYSKDAASADSASTVAAFANNPALLALLGKSPDLAGYTPLAKSKVAGDLPSQLADASGAAGIKNAAAYASLLQSIKGSEVASALALLDANKGVETTASRKTNSTKKTETAGSGIMGMISGLF